MNSMFLRVTTSLGDGRGVCPCGTPGNAETGVEWVEVCWKECWISGLEDQGRKSGSALHACHSGQVSLFF